MTSQTTDWISAASCFEGPRPGTLFSDLPRPHQREVLRLASAAALSSLFFITLGVLGQVIPSRSLAMPVLMPRPAAASVALVPADPRLPLDTPVRRPGRPHATRPPAGIQLASVTAPTSSENQTGAEAATRERRPTFLGRLFRGVLHPTRVIAAG